MEKISFDFLKESLRHQLELKKSLEQKASFLTALAGVLFGLSVSRLDQGQFLVLAIGTFLTVLLTVTAVFMPFRGKIKGGKSLICWWGFAEKNFEEYKNSLANVFQSEEKIAEEFEKEIWNLSEYSLKPKTKLLAFASFFLIAGLVLSFALFFV